MGLYGIFASSQDRGTKSHVWKDRTHLWTGDSITGHSGRRVMSNAYICWRCLRWRLNTSLDADPLPSLLLLPDAMDTGPGTWTSGSEIISARRSWWLEWLMCRLLVSLETRLSVSLSVSVCLRRSHCLSVAPAVNKCTPADRKIFSQCHTPNWFNCEFAE